jgi:hypothetical protein
MCGVFGFCGPEPDRQLIRDLAALAGRRGPHACGWAFLDTHSGTIKVERRLGSLADHAEHIPASPIVIGHSRLATTGNLSYRNLRDAQPLTLPGAATETRGKVLVHNGVARVNVDGPLDTGCDSEKLLRLTTGATLAFALGMLPESEPFAVLLASPGGIHAARRLLPLQVRHTKAGTYLCSVPFDGSESLAGMVHVKSPA